MRGPLASMQPWPYRDRGRWAGEDCDQEDPAGNESESEDRRCSPTETEHVSACRRRGVLLRLRRAVQGRQN